MTRTGKKLHIRILASCTAAVMIAATAYAAQEPMVFPAKGQSNEKMESDKNGCYTWAKGQTGFDPMQSQPAATPAPSTAKGGAGRGAAGGAALGAAVGAIAGSAGTGAAIGAASGGIIGGARKQKSKKEQEQSAQQQTAAIEQKQSDYTRAYGACMEGKGYSVK